MSSNVLSSMSGSILLCARTAKKIKHKKKKKWKPSPVSGARATNYVIGRQEKPEKREGRVRARTRKELENNLNILKYDLCIGQRILRRAWMICISAPWLVAADVKQRETDQWLKTRRRGFRVNSFVSAKESTR